MIPNINNLKPNPDNPRTISKKQFEKLKKSLASFIKMLKIRPIAYDEDGIVWGGNMRFRGLQELVNAGVVADSPDYYKLLDGYTLEEKKEFAVRDNVEYGEWDMDLLIDRWDEVSLKEWGIDFAIGKDDFYARGIKAPVYEPSNVKPELSELVDETKVDKLLKDIEESKIPEEIKNFLWIAAYRHYVFNYQKIADYYANANKEVQKLMEDSALVIIDYNKAVENGYVALITTLMDVQNEDYEE